MRDAGSCGAVRGDTRWNPSLLLLKTTVPAISGTVVNGNAAFFSDVQQKLPPLLLISHFRTTSTLTHF
jgi:hypothetical protein